MKNKLISGLAMGAVALMGLTACSTPASSGGDSGGSGKVFMLLPFSTTPRYEERDAPGFIEAMKKYSPEAEVSVNNAQGDASKQQQQVEDAITKGASLIVLVAPDPNLASGALGVAAQAKVPVVLYEHDAKGGPADAFVRFDSLVVGQEQGKRAAEVINKMPGQGIKVARVMGNAGDFGTVNTTKGQDEYLKPLIDSGKITVACEQNIPGWDPTKAQAFVEDCLTKTNNGVQLVISQNDGMAGGAIAALTTQNLQRKVAVTGGQDAELRALQYIAQGVMDSTVYKEIPLLADKAAQVTSSILSGNGVPKDAINGEFDTGVAKIPSIAVKPETVTIDSLQRVVDDGLVTWKQICEGAEQEPVCVENLK